MPNNNEVKYLDSAMTQQLITDIKTRLATKVIHYSSMPAVTATTNPNDIVLYTGATTQDYTNGDFYKADVTNLEWVKMTYNKSEIDAAISAAGHFILVAELPTTNIQTNAIYLVPKTATISAYSDGTANADAYVSTGTAAEPTYDKYEYDSTLGIYIYSEEITSTDAETIKGYIDGGTYTASNITAETRESNNIKAEYINLTGTTAGWEKIGDTRIDLSAYVKFEDLVPITSAELEAMWED